MQLQAVALPALAGPGGSGGARSGIAAPDGAANDPGIDIAQINGRVRASSVKKVAEVVDQHPDESVQIIRGWLNNA
jgi:flagellar M-ring protein FliF